MSVALIEPFDRLRNHPSTGSGTTRRNDCYTKCGGFDKLNHRNANLLDSPMKVVIFFTNYATSFWNIFLIPWNATVTPGTKVQLQKQVVNNRQQHLQMFHQQQVVF